MIVARAATELAQAGRSVAIGTFDGVHLGHRAVIEATRDSGLRSTIVTFDPHPREVLGYGVQLLSTLERRLELIASIGPDEVLLLEFTSELSLLSPEEFVRAALEPIGTKIVIAGEDFRFGHSRSGDVELLRKMGFEVRSVPIVPGVSSSRIRELLQQGDVGGAARLLGRPAEVEGTVVAGDKRGGTLGFPTANLAVPANMLVPGFGIYAGAAFDRNDPASEQHRAAVSIGVNPHYGGSERRIEAFLLDFEGDLYGRRLRVELWQRLREERVFDDEQALVEQIGRDVAATRSATPPPL
jgi:riboflavin kinase / FMN adenylyltransferase